MSSISRSLASQTGATYTVPTLAALKALTSRPEAVIVETGQAKGVWQWELGSSTTADDALVVNPTSGTAGRYKRVFDGPFNVLWFGADPLGITDSTTAIQAALTAAGVVAGSVYMPSGSYKVSSTLSMVTNTTLCGDESSQSYFSFATHDFDVISVGATAVDCTIRDIGFIGGGAFGTAKYAIKQVAGGSNLKIKDIYALNCVRGIYVCSGNTEIDSARIRLLKPTTGVGIEVEIGAGVGEICRIREAFIEGDSAAEPYAGVWIKSGSDIELTNPNLNNCGNGVAIEPDNGQAVASVKIFGGGSDSGAANGVKIAPTGTGTVLRVELHGHQMTSNTARGFICSGLTGGLLISGCLVGLNGSDGIYLSCTDTGVEDIEGAIVTGCLIGGNTGTGIVCEADLSNFSLIGNIVGDVCGYGANGAGITVQTGGSDSYVIVGNHVAGNTGNELTDGGSGTNKVVNWNIGLLKANSGTGSITSGATTATVNHGLGVTPVAANIAVVFTEQGTNDYGRWWISGLSSTQFTLNVSADPGASNLDFSWQAFVP